MAYYDDPKDDRISSLECNLQELANRNRKLTTMLNESINILYRNELIHPTVISEDLFKFAKESPDSKYHIWKKTIIEKLESSDDKILVEVEKLLK